MLDEAVRRARSLGRSDQGEKASKSRAEAQHDRVSSMVLFLLVLLHVVSRFANRRIWKYMRRAAGTRERRREEDHNTRAGTKGDSAGERRRREYRGRPCSTGTSKLLS